jgi:hypothetical protein
MRPNNLILTIFLLTGFIAVASAGLAVTLTASTPNAIDIGQNVIFTNSTSGGVTPYSWVYTSDNWSGVIQQGNTFFFNKAGQFNLGLDAYDGYSNITHSSNVVVVVNENPSVTINTINTTVVVGIPEALNAIVQGGTAPFTFKWFNTSSCTGTANATTENYMTANILTESYFCVKVTDAVNVSVETSGYLQPQQAVYTPSGEEIGIDGLMVEIAPVIRNTTSGGVVISNITQGVKFNITFCGDKIPVQATALTPDYLGFTASGTYYQLQPNQSKALQGGLGCMIRLDNISWTPMLHVDTLEFEPELANVMAATTSSTTTIIPKLEVAGTPSSTTLTSTTYTTSWTTSLPRSTSLATTSVSTSNTQADNVVINPPPNPSINGQLELLIGTIIVVIAMIVAARMYWKRKQNKDTPEPKQLLRPPPQSSKKRMIVRPPKQAEAEFNEGDFQKGDDQ